MYNIFHFLKCGRCILSKWLSHAQKVNTKYKRNATSQRDLKVKQSERKNSKSTSYFKA